MKICILIAFPDGNCTRLLFHTLPGFSLTDSGVCVKEYYCGLNLFAYLRLQLFLKAEPKKITYMHDAIQESKDEGHLGVIEK